MSSSPAASAYCFLSFRHFFSILISWAKHFHVSDVKLAGASSISKTYCHFSFTTGSVGASGVQRMMGMHGSMVTAVFRCGWKQHFFPRRPVVWKNVYGDIEMLLPPWYCKNLQYGYIPTGFSCYKRFVSSCTRSWPLTPIAKFLHSQHHGEPHFAGTRLQHLSPSALWCLHTRYTLISKWSPPYSSH